MAVSQKALNEKLRNVYLEKVKALFASNEEVLLTGSNEIAFPVVDEAGNDNWIVVTVKVPTGSRDGDAYDGYEMAEEYRLKCEERETKAKEAAAKKAAKIAKDKATREAKAKAKAEREATKTE